MGHYKQAIESFQSATSFKPNSVLAHYNLGLALLRVRDRAAAIEQYKTLSGLSEAFATKLYGGIYRGKVLIVAKR
jgi:tetratricopeptide (TPR) repeat protein